MNFVFIFGLKKLSSCSALYLCYLSSSPCVCRPYVCMCLIPLSSWLVQHVILYLLQHPHAIPSPYNFPTYVFIAWTWSTSSKHRTCDSSGCRYHSAGPGPRMHISTFCTAEHCWALSSVLNVKLSRHRCLFISFQTGWECCLLLLPVCSHISVKL